MGASLRKQAQVHKGSSAMKNKCKASLETPAGRRALATSQCAQQMRRLYDTARNVSHAHWEELQRCS